MEWISVKDRLPPNSDEVLLYCQNDIVQGYLKDGIYKGSIMVTDNMYDGYVNDRKICNQGGFDDFITHWMPLPGPPKE